MTTYSFAPTADTQQFPDWNDPTIWSTGSVPNSTAADVILAPVTNGTYPYYDVQIASGSSIALHSLTASGVDLGAPQITLTVGGAVSISGESQVSMAGSLTAGSLSNTGDPVEGFIFSGTLNVAGELYNSGLLEFRGATVTAGQFDNEGLLSVAVGSTLTINSPDFVNFQDGRLTGGSWYVGAGFQQQGAIIDLKTDGVIQTLAAHVVTGGDLAYPPGESEAGALNFFDPQSQSYVPIQSTLTTIASGGNLEVSSGHYTNAHSLSLQGTLTLDDGIFSAPVLTVQPSGLVTTTGLQPILTGLELMDNGTVEVLANSSENSLLTIGETVVGHGNLLIGPAVNTPTYDGGAINTTTATLELTGGAATTITFGDGTGTLILDMPTKISSTLHGTVAGDQIVLAGINLADVTSYNYVGCTTSGELTVNEAGHAIHLLFAGNYTTSSFGLTAYNGGPGVVITDLV